MTDTEDYHCPVCGEHYKMMRVESPFRVTDRELTCLACGAPMSNRQGRFVLKYFRDRKRKPDDVVPR